MMQLFEQFTRADSTKSPMHLPISVVIPVKNEERNLPECLKALRDVGEIFVVDSFSTDATVEIARSYGAKVVQFDYRGGWPKKRQWALDTLTFCYDWILLLDADEVLTLTLRNEIREAIKSPWVNGYLLQLRMLFFGRLLRHGDASFNKLSLFRRVKARFECRLEDQDSSMCDMEVHEHIVVDGPTVKLPGFLLHRNVDSLSRYICKHDQYSNWEARVLSGNEADSRSIPASLFGTQAQRRRWLKQKAFRLPGSSFLLFLYRYFIRLGFLDGVPGLIYCAFQGIQMFHTKAKMYELRMTGRAARSDADVIKPAKLRSGTA